MTRKKDINQILDLLICPGFCVQDNRIIKTNPAADALLLVPGTDVRSLLLTGSEEYEAFRDGSLYLKLNLTQEGLGCCVIRQDGTDYFLLDQPVQDEALQALALAARELRSAMSGAFVSADQIAHKADPETARCWSSLPG
jgi:hypothetical protein